MSDIKQLVGNQIRLKRIMLKMSQEDLALKSGLDRTYITSVENGRRNISIINIEKICIALNCSLSDFFYFKEDK